MVRGWLLGEVDGVGSGCEESIDNFATSESSRSTEARKALLCPVKADQVSLV